MKLFVVKGYGYDPTEFGLETYAKVCASQAEAEKELHDIAEEQVSFVEGETYYGATYVETLRKRNGNIIDYKLEMIYDISDKEQKESFLRSTLVIGGGINNEDFQPLLNDCSSKIKIIKQCSISISEKSWNKYLKTNKNEYH